MTGPVFVAMFKPLGIIITVVVGIIFMGETFYLGRLAFYLFDIFLLVKVGYSDLSRYVY